MRYKDKHKFAPILDTWSVKKCKIIKLVILTKRNRLRYTENIPVENGEGEGQNRSKGLKEVQTTMYKINKLL